MISNLEKVDAKMMSLTQCIVIRAVPDYEAKEHPENDVLPKAVHLLLDEEGNLSEEDYTKVKEAIPLSIAEGIAPATWLKSVMEKDKEK